MCQKIFFNKYFNGILVIVQTVNIEYFLFNKVQITREKLKNYLNMFVILFFLILLLFRFKSKAVNWIINISLIVKYF